MSRVSRIGHRTRIALAAAIVGTLGASVVALAPTALAENSSQATVAPDEMLERAETWLTANNGSPVPYSQKKTWTDGYRQDCSGFVSMTLKLSTPGETTVTLAGDRDLTTPISLAELKPGDLLIDADGDNHTRHVVIFAGWTDSSKSAYEAYEQRGGHGTDHRVLTYGLESGSEYKPYRPNNFTGEEPPESPSWPKLESGSNGTHVKAVQYLLEDHGYSIDVDGSFGEQTKSTVEEFQEANDLHVDGVVGPATWPVLVKKLRYEDEGSAVKALQVELNRQDGGDLLIDGEFGPVTKDAVKSFQESNDLKVDAVVGPVTWKALLSA